MAVCPYCHQHIAVQRLGVRMPPLKARIVDAIKAAGDIGISNAELTCEVYRGYDSLRSRRSTKAHVWQINELLVETDWLIQSEGRGVHARWYLRRRPMMREAAE